MVQYIKTMRMTYALGRTDDFSQAANVPDLIRAKSRGCFSAPLFLIVLIGLTYHTRQPHPSSHDRTDTAKVCHVCDVSLECTCRQIWRVLCREVNWTAMLDRLQAQKHMRKKTATAF